MSKILVVIGSAREGRVADHVLKYVSEDLEARQDIEVIVADLKQLNLPFLDSEHIPASPDFRVAHDSVKEWMQLVDEADGVVLLMPEYNHSMSAIQKNAIDWIYAEWNEKPVSVVGYGWSGAVLALETATRVLGNVKAKLLPGSAHLRFMKEINPDGSPADEATIVAAVHDTLDELAAEIAIPVAV